MRDLCIDARMAFSSGIGTYIRQIVPLLKDFRILLLVDRLDASWCRDFEQILLKAPIYSIQEQLLLPVKIPKCDLFWSPHYTIPLAPIRAKKRVVTIHDVCHLTFGNFAERVYAKQMIRFALRYSHRVLTVSQFSKKEIEKFFKCEKIEVIPIAVNREQFVRKPASQELRKKYRLPERYALFVGNFKKHKNVEGLIRAFSNINIPNLGLVLVGKGMPIGQVLDEELPAVYSMAEMFIFPSFYEGFGLPPLEAMSCGCPTAVSNVASMPEVCGNASFYFNPHKEEEIAEAIGKLAADPKLRQNLIERGSERIKSFSWTRTAEHHLKIFQEACYA